MDILQHSEVDSRSRSRSRSPRSQQIVPANLLSQHDNEMSYIVHVKMIATGPVQQVLQNVGAKIIAKTALGQFRSVAFDQVSQKNIDINNGELLGGHNISISSTSEPSTFRANLIRAVIID